MKSANRNCVVLLLICGVAASFTIVVFVGLTIFLRAMMLSDNSTLPAIVDDNSEIESCMGDDCFGYLAPLPEQPVPEAQSEDGFTKHNAIRDGSFFWGMVALSDNVEMDAAYRRDEAAYNSIAAIAGESAIIQSYAPDLTWIKSNGQFVNDLYIYISAKSEKYGWFCTRIEVDGHCKVDLVSWSTINEALNFADAPNTIVIIDTDYAGKAVPILAAPGRTIIAATGEDELNAHDALGSIFTRHLAQCITERQSIDALLDCAEVAGIEAEKYNQHVVISIN